MNTMTMPASPRLALSVGPLLYHWSRETVLQFYADLAESPADTIVLGETVCARRRELRLEDWLALGRELRAAGKDVVLAAQALIETEADLRLLERQAEQQEFAVEAADASALQLLAGRVPLVLGPHINIYSREALAEHADLGASRWVAPVELSLDALALINPPADPVRTSAGEAIATEAWVFGRLPLAFSARCFTARHHNLQKDACEYRCLGVADGLDLRTREGAPFLTINGTQTQSAGVYTLLRELPALAEAGVDVVRVSPQGEGTFEVLAAFRDAIDGVRAAADAFASIAGRLPGAPCNGFWHGRPGVEYVTA